MSAPALHLAEAINREHQAAIGAARTAIEHAIECGRLLIEAKAQMAHGGWLPWLEANTSVSARQSQRYMRLAAAVLEGKCDATSYLSQEAVLDALATPKPQRLIADERAEYLPRHLAPIPQPGEGLVNLFWLTDPAEPPEDVADQFGWKVEHRVASAVALLEPTRVPGYVWPAVVCASLPGAKWTRDDDRPFTAFWLGHKAVAAAGVRCGSVLYQEGPGLPGVAAESAESILRQMYHVPVEYMRGRWRRYPCARQADNRYLALDGFDPWNVDHPAHWLNAQRPWRDIPAELSSDVLAFAEDINGDWQERGEP